MIKSKFKKQVFEEAAKVSDLTYQIGQLTGLRKKSKELKLSEIKNLETQQIIKRLKKTLIEYRKLTGKGRGVAAIQIGVPLKIGAVFYQEKILTIINPKITKKSEDRYLYPEICMSANPIIAKVIRPEFIEFEYFNEKGEKQFWEDKDRLLNRVFQHEIDHMDGILFLSKVENIENIWKANELDEYIKVHKKYPEMK